MNISDFVTFNNVATKSPVKPIKPFACPTIWPAPRPSERGEKLYTDILAAQGGSIPPVSNRFWLRGNFCGIHVDGLPSVKGGAADSTLVFAPFLDRYSPENQDKILREYASVGYVDYLLSWPNSKGEMGYTIDQYVNLALKVKSTPSPRGGFLRPNHMIYSGGDAPNANDDLIKALVAAKAIDKACIGFEVNIYFTPAEITALVHHCATLINESMGVPLYIEFIETEMESGVGFQEFWSEHRQELTGLWFETMQADCPADKQGRINDWQTRTLDSGFGHLFYMSVFENTAMYQFGLWQPVMDNCAANQDGYYTVCNIYSLSDPGRVPIMGYGNGAMMPGTNLAI